MATKITSTQILDALNSLGESPEEVASALQAKGIKGRRGSGHGCPITNFVIATFSRDAYAGGMRTFIYGVGECGCKTPDACSTFMRLFDDGQFPQLDMESP